MTSKNKALLLIGRVFLHAVQAGELGFSKKKTHVPPPPSTFGPVYRPYSAGLIVKLMN